LRRGTIVVTVTTSTTPTIVGDGTVETINTAPADGGTGGFVVEVGGLNGAQTATFTFSVKIDE
jgi:hypothetical protein